MVRDRLGLEPLERGRFSWPSTALCQLIRIGSSSPSTRSGYWKRDCVWYGSRSTDPGVSSAEVQAESERAQLELPLKKARKHPGRQELPADLPRIEQIVACTPEQCVCGNCGKETSVIGYETAEQLDVEPAKYFVRVTKREKRACKACEEQGVRCAPLPPRI